MPDNELLLERLERLAIVLDELMPQCAELVRDTLSLLKLQQLDIEALKNTIQGMVEGQCIIAGDKRVDIVRCQDCKHYNIIGCAGGFGWCERYDVGHTDEWFCADGKRKEGL